MIKGSYGCLLFLPFSNTLYISDNFFTNGEFYMPEIQFLQREKTYELHKHRILGDRY